MKITFTKLKQTNTWGLRAEQALTEGASVTVSKADGSTTTATVGRRVWDNGKVWLYETAGSSRSNGAARGGNRRPFRPCGYPGCNPAHCDECGGEGWAGANSW